MLTLDEIQRNWPRRLTKRYRNEQLKPALSSVDCFNASFLSPKDNSAHGCDIRQVIQFFSSLHEKCRRDRVLDGTVKEAIKELITKLPKRPSRKEELRVYLMLPACHFMTDAKTDDSIICPFASAVKNLNECSKQILADWLETISLKHFERHILIFKNAVCRLIPKWMTYRGTSSTIFTNLESCLWLLEKLYKMNEMREEKVQETFFYVPELSTYFEFIHKDFTMYISRQNLNPTQFFFSKYPFLFNGELKHRLLGVSNNLQMEGPVLVLYIFNQPLCLRVRGKVNQIVVDRTNIIEDAMTQLQCLQSKDENVHKTDLSILFKGENDYGPGVTREFFTLVFQELLKPSFGLFTYLDDSSRVMWFNSKESDLHYFHFAGSMLGLALYHSQFISLPFPLAVFKKLLGIGKMDHKDLLEIRPDITKNLQLILDMNQAEDLEYFYFEVSDENNGETVTHELCENGSNIQVTIDNRNDYVRLMMDYYLNKLVIDTEKESDQFYNGFYQAYNSKTLELLKFQPSELRSNFIGQEMVDTAYLEKNAIYSGGYNHDSQAIRNFWDIIHSLPEEDKRKFVHFVTGSERVPLSGLQIEISPRPPLGVERVEDVMPEARTCYLELLLPDILDKERLRERLLSALNGSYEFTNAEEMLQRPFYSDTFSTPWGAYSAVACKVHHTGILTRSLITHGQNTDETLT